MDNPVIATLIRGNYAESHHRGAWAVVGPGGHVQASVGNIARPVFPRSAIKAFQCLPLVESGAADAFGLDDADIALCCSSHTAEAPHVARANAILARLGLGVRALECGTHDPIDRAAFRALIVRDEPPCALHNTCSGKHAGMLAQATHLGADITGYVRPGHVVQREIAATLEGLCDVKLDRAPMGIDGCSVPTWGIPLEKLALGFQRFGSGETLSPLRAAAAARIIAAVRAHPFLVEGTGRFCTDLMEAVPRVFIKTGVEGVCIATIPHAGLGLALKCDDGAGRAAEVAMAQLLAGLDVWTPQEQAALASASNRTLHNWRKLETGHVTAHVTIDNDNQ